MELILSSAPIVAAAVFAAAAGLAWVRLSPIEISRQTAWHILAAWTALITAHYWIAGPYSYADLTYDLGNSVARTLFLIDRLHSGHYAYNFAGGVDVPLINASTGAWVYLNEFLLQLLPAWPAYVFHKVAVVAVGAVGVYLLVRRAAGAGRVVAVLLAMFASVASDKLTHFSFNHALGHAMVPLLTYAVVFRAARRWYWPLVLFLGVLWTISGTPTHAGMGLFASLSIGWIFFGAQHRSKVAAAIVIIGIMVLANWNDGIWAKYLLGNLTVRGVGNPNLHDSLTVSVLRVLRSFEWEQAALAALGLIGVLVAFAGNSARKGQLLGIWLTTTLLAFVMLSFPWQLIGLRLLNGLSWWNTLLAGNAWYPLIVAFALRDEVPTKPLRIARPAIMALAAVLVAAQAGHLVSERSIHWLLLGGIRNMTTAIVDIRAAKPNLNTEFRAVTVTERLESNFTAAAGLPTWDGLYNPFLARKMRYWHDAVMRGQTSPWMFLPAEQAHRIAESAAEVDAGSLFDLDALRAINVGYIVSRVPLAGLEITQVAGPVSAKNPARQPPGFVPRLEEKLRLALNPPPVLVYALKNPLPPVFAARHVVVGNPVANDFAHVAGRAALSRGAILESPSGVEPVVPANLRILSWDVQDEKIAIDVDAPDGGVVVVVLPYLPYWRAQIDGRPIQVAPANLVHMAMAVPPGGRHIVLRYERPNVISHLLGKK